MDKELVHDQKTKFRFEQISVEGNDPQQSGESVGTPSDMQSPDEEGGGEDDVAGSIFDQDEGGSPEGGFEGAGRPKEVSKYGKDGSARGREPLGRPKIPIALAHYDALKKSFGSKASEILNETLESDKINEEYEEFKEEK
jgi:hypothetical protein|tara:strand:- start:662 stop:1081 length:420 start_codon:yes stop_codon:yes gene_type:complete